jgi:hypothetical protein
MAGDASPSAAGTCRRHAPRDLQLRRFEQQIADFRNQSAQDNDIGIEDRHEVCDRHADVFGRIANNRHCNAVVIPGRFEDLPNRDRVQVAVRKIENARAVARLDSPDDAPHDAGFADLRTQATELAVVLALDWIQGQPAHGAGQSVRAAE